MSAKSDFAGARHLALASLDVCLNALLPEPSLLAIYSLGLWDGFLHRLALQRVAATSSAVGRENLMQAGAITILTVRLGSVISPMIGGLLLATGGVTHGTTRPGGGEAFITLLPLLSLPALPPPPQPRRGHPLKSLLAGFRFLLASPLVGGLQRWVVY